MTLIPLRICRAATLLSRQARPGLGELPEPGQHRGRRRAIPRDALQAGRDQLGELAGQAGQVRLLGGHARYVTAGKLDAVFNFPYLSCPWDAAALRRVIEQTLALDAQGARATWVLSNHDVDRIVSRYGRADTAFDLLRRRYFHNFPVDLALGTKQARAAALLTMALPEIAFGGSGGRLLGSTTSTLQQNCYSSTCRLWRASTRWKNFAPSSL